jgi:hypothetical protein
MANAQGSGTFDLDSFQIFKYTEAPCLTRILGLEKTVLQEIQFNSI